jgi:hypothetical protein
MMRTYFARNLYSPRLRIAQQAHASARTDVLAMDGRIAEFGQQDIAGDNNFLPDARPSWQAKPQTPFALMHHTVANKRVVLAMIKDRQIKHPGILECAAHDFVVLHAMTVIGDCHDSGRDHRSIRGQLFSRDTFCYRARREDIDARSRLGLFTDQCDRPGIVGDRTCIRHANNA